MKTLVTSWRKHFKKSIDVNALPFMYVSQQAIEFQF